MKSLSLNTKIWSVIILLAVAYVGTTGMGLKQLSAIRDRLDLVTGPISRADALTSEVQNQQRLLSIYVLQSIVMTKEEHLKENTVGYQGSIKKMQGALDELEKVASPRALSSVKEYRETLAQLLKEFDRAQALGAVKKNEEATVVFLDARTHIVTKLNQKVDELNAITAEELKAASEEAHGVVSSAIWLSIVTALASILFCLGFAWVVLRAMSSSIATIMSILGESSNQVSSAAAQIASASQQLSQATTEQAASLEETAASVEEMNAMVAKNSENASASATTSVASQTRANEGKQTVGKMTSSMGEISRSNDAIMNQITVSNQSMSDIVKVIEQIEKKTHVINEIVNKTELLSFNASVEAARAGEHGKGFAVVAEEVGKLARMSGEAAEEIGELLEQSIGKVNQTVADTKSSIEKLMIDGKRIVDGGVDVARECGEVFDEVALNVNTLSSKAKEIASASEEQSRGITEITKAMSQLDQMTQQNAATSEECAAAAEELSAQAESLKNAVVQLAITIKGAGQTGTSTKPSVPVAPRVQQSSAKNVVHLKRRVETPAPAAKAVGQTPDYNSDGFRDI